MTESEIQTQVQQILDTMRPAVVSHGGDIQFVSYEQNIVYVKLSGACVRCPGSFFTLKLGVEDAIKKQLPFIKSVEAVVE